MSRILKTAGVLATLAIAASLTPAAAQDASSAPLEGTITVWHSYGSGAGTEPDAFNAVLDAVKAANPGLTVNVAPQPFGNIFDNWKLEVASGGTSPDLMIVPNDNLGQQTRDELIAPIDAKYTFPDTLQLAIDGSTVNGALMQVPESLKAVGLYYDTAKVATPPATTDDLLTAVKGGLKLGLLGGTNIYHNFGWAGAFGGKLMDDTGKCTASAGGFADAFKYLADLQAAGATFLPNYDDMANGFKDGTFDAIVDGPWAAGGYLAARPTMGVAAMPAGPAGPALPFTGVDGYVINPNGQTDLATRFAIAMTGVDGQTTFANKAFHIPANSTISITDPISKQFAAAVASGYPRPQSAQFGAFWGPFGDALSKVLTAGADPVQAVADACTAMDTANKL